MLRERWSQLLDRRREYLNAQIQRYINKLDKTELECEREVRDLVESFLQKPRPTADRLSSGSLADFLARKDLADFFCFILLLDCLAVGFPYSVNNILSYLNLI